MRNKLLALRIISTAVMVLLLGSFWALHGPTWANFAVGVASGLSLGIVILAWQGQFDKLQPKVGEPPVELHLNSPAKS